MDMEVSQKPMQRFWIFGISLLVWVIVATFLSIGVQLQIQAEKNHQREEVYRQLLVFQSQVENTLGANSSLFRGFISFLAVSDEEIPENTERILDSILTDNSHMVRNIGVLKDTTIIYNYPQSPNQSSIGVDLAKVPGQRDMVLKVKNQGVDAFVGPVRLVQGGMGFISRQAIVKNGRYWGQISIVLDADAFQRQLSDVAGYLGLSYAFHEKSENQNPIVVGQQQILDGETLSSDIQLFDTQWTLSVLPEEGWRDFSLYKILGYVVPAIVAFIPALLLFLLLKTRAKLHVLAIHDSLTGLFNRNFFQQYHPLLMARAKRQGERIGFALIDLNDFKQINDSYGHMAGDKVLKTVATLLRDNSRDSDWVYRFGGDEFLVCLSHINTSSDITAAHRRLNEILSFNMVHKNHHIWLSPSVGIALYPDESENIDELLHIADLRMYEHKNSRKAMT